MDKVTHKITVPKTNVENNILIIVRGFLCFFFLYCRKQNTPAELLPSMVNVLKSTIQLPTGH